MGKALAKKKKGQSAGRKKKAQMKKRKRGAATKDLQILRFPASQKRKIEQRGT